MKVLIGGFDLFSSVGGGQTYYRSAILRNPDIEFHYFRQHESEQADRPANARALAFEEYYQPESLADYDDPSVPHWLFRPFLWAQNVARAAAGNSYDVVEAADYYDFGLFLRPALQAFDVRVGRHVLAMHGALTRTLFWSWGSDGSIDLPLRQIETMQYEVADLRYGISQSYRDEWRGYSKLESHYLDPMWFFDAPEPLPYRPQTDLPILRFIGRVEKLKGPHLFVEMASWLPRSAYDSAEIIGPDCPRMDGTSAAAELAAMIQRRGLSIRIEKPRSRGELASLFATRSVVFLPSLCDTLNLVALEALFSGCPTVIGKPAGVCRYLKERFPSIPFLEFDTDHFFGNIPRIIDFLDDYDRQRSTLAHALERLDKRPVGPSLTEIYSADPMRDRRTSELTEAWYKSLAKSFPGLAAKQRCAAAA